LSYAADKHGQTDRQTDKQTDLNMLPRPTESVGVANKTLPLSTHSAVEMLHDSALYKLTIGD